MEIAQLVLEYLNLLFSPQIVFGVLAILFGWKFKDDIRALMKRIAKISFPGGEVTTSQQERSEEEPPPAPSDDKLPDVVSLDPEQQKLVAQHFQAERTRSTLWEYRYLNFFLVPHTKRVLAWLASLSSPASVPFYFEFWLPSIPDPNERQAVLNALNAHFLTRITGELVEVTDKGREYLAWSEEKAPGTAFQS